MERVTSAHLRELFGEDQKEAVARLGEAFEDQTELLASLCMYYQDKGFSEETIMNNVEQFLNYWTERNRKGSMRWEGEKYFEILKRLATWFSRIKVDFERTQPKVWKC